MSDLLAMLRQGASDLAAHRTASETASHNIANANTPGYSRQRANLEARLPAERIGGVYIGQGVTVGSVTQARDRFVETQLPASISMAARSSSQADALEGVQALDPRSGLGDSISNFYAALRQLSQNPGDIPSRQAALGAANSLGLSFNRAAKSLADARNGLDSQVSGSVAEINAVAAQVAALNDSVRKARALGNAPNDLMDARQKAMDRLTELTGAVSVPSSDGSVTMVLGQGTALVSGAKSATVSGAPDPTNDGHIVLELLRPDGTGPVAVRSEWGGQVGGWLDARDGAIQTAQDSLDTLAFDLTNAVNTAHQTGFGLDGVGSRDLLDAGASAAGAASRLSVSGDMAGDPRRIGAASSAAAGPGDGTNLALVLGTELQALSTGSTANGTLAQTISQFGASSFSARAISDQDSALKDHLTQMRESVSGVSIDEELVNLTQSQRAFEAVSKVIQTTNEMLATLMALKPPA